MKALFGILALCSFLAVHGEFENCEDDIVTCNNARDSCGTSCECLQDYYDCMKTIDCEADTKNTYSLYCSYDNYKEGCDLECPPRNDTECQMSTDPCAFDILDCIEEVFSCSCYEDYLSCVSSYECYADDEVFVQETEYSCAVLNVFNGCNIPCPVQCQQKEDQCFQDATACIDEGGDFCSCFQEAYDCILPTGCNYEQYYDLCISDECELDCETSNCDTEVANCHTGFEMCQGDSEELNCECNQALMDCVFASSCDESFETSTCLYYSEECPNIDCHVDNDCEGGAFDCIWGVIGCKGEDEDLSCECFSGFVNCLSGLPCTTEEQQESGFYEICDSSGLESSCGVDCATLFPPETSNTTSSNGTTEETTASTTNTEENGRTSTTESNGITTLESASKGNTAITENTANTGSTTNTGNTANTENTANTGNTAITEDTSNTGNTANTKENTKETENTGETKQSSEGDVDDAGKLCALYSLVTIAVIWTSIF